MRLAANMSIEVRDMGLVDYNSAHELQRQCVQKRLDGGDDVVLLLEHPPVFTLGQSGKMTSLLKSREEIARLGVDIVRTERGGDITYHGPGQLVAYPIVNLKSRKLSVSGFIEGLEEIMLCCAADVGVTASRDDRNRGIWVGDNKIGSVGIRIRHGVSFHGLALNVNLSLDPFSWVNPCGLTGVGVSSLAKELGRELDMAEVKASMTGYIHHFLGKEVCRL